MATFRIFSNNDELSDRIEAELVPEMESAGYVRDESRQNTDIIFCIGGDGALLRLLRTEGFPDAMIVGINTGHLGFFQEVTPDGIHDFVEKLKKGDYHVQEYIGMKIRIHTTDGVTEFVAINEVVIKGVGERLTHLEVGFGKSSVTRYSGDGILVCTPAGSTAYNYSLGGVIMDPAVDTLQVTPMAPVNNIAYRSFQTGILLPTDASITVVPKLQDDHDRDGVMVIEDGRVVARGRDVQKVCVMVADKKARIFRFSGYDFWTKVQSKILGER
ncbi:MAG: NAD(+)/NADH kinase [Clostridia bacterium]|nr:NAD(+)/NADH kinase [Clostridia bacterium]